MPEILAPAGNMDMLKAAVVGGADAVYLGLSKFSARAKAANFDEEQLKQAIDYAHLFGVKVYAAINTVMKNSELNDALCAAIKALDLKADALILQDLGLAQEIRAKRPTAVLHASTQMGIHNEQGAITAKKLGFSRIILSRETLISDIIKIKKNVDIEIECFVQGALCIAFSGNCYLSSFVSGFSGNRGKCMQLCRKQYSTTYNGTVKNGYLLSAKDLMLANKIGELITAGVDCFKIEGRLRRAEYVAESVRVYKNAIKGCFNNSDLLALKKTFNRGDYTDGHLFVGTNKVLDVNVCAHKGAYFGKVIKIAGSKAILSRALNKGDGVKFLRSGIEVGGASITKSGVETGFEGNVKVGDEVYITTDSEFNKSVLLRTRKLNVDVAVDFDKSTLTLTQGDVCVSLNILSAQPAQNAPITAIDVKSNFNKSEYFQVNDVSVVGKPSFILKSDFNSLRRNAYELLFAHILAKYESNMQKYEGNYQTMSDIIRPIDDNFLDKQTIYQVETPEQITKDMGIIAINPREYSVEKLSKFKPYYSKALLCLPMVARGKDLDILTEIISTCDFRGYIINNLYGVELTLNKQVLLGYGLNLINDKINAPKIYSIESDEILRNGYVYSQGNVPLMTFCHCEKKELFSGCENCKGYDLNISYKKRDFYLRRYKIYYCYAQLLNCADLDIRSKLISKEFVDLSYKRTGNTTKANYGRGLK
ncbi:MAG: U32 family peptidase [Clostridia bacterium]|nr:U32 family peptidase [Clostridia bacterium]